MSTYCKKTIAQGLVGTVMMLDFLSIPHVYGALRMLHQP